MTGAVNNLAASLAGSQPQAASAVKEAKRKDDDLRRKGIRDRYEPIVVELESAAAVRNLKDTAGEETREEREQQNAAYSRNGNTVPDPHSRLDVSG